MLVATYLEGVVKGFVVGSLSELENFITEKYLETLNLDMFDDRPVVVKGCSDLPIPLYAYGRLISLLKTRAKSVMFGEPCSTVPLYKKPKH